MSLWPRVWDSGTLRFDVVIRRWRRRAEMQADELLRKLGYDQSPNFLRGNDLARAPDYGHIFRRAKEKPCRLQGVYALRDPRAAGTPPIVPVVYVCRAASESHADEIHRLVWNQNVVPFVIVHTDEDVRLYSGFRCQDSADNSERGLLLLKAFNRVSEIVDGFRAEAIDSGKLWKEWGPKVTPETRVEWELLDNLQRLDRWLQDDGGLQREASHALIGKYVYLHYLRDRKILSQRKLAGWDIAEQEVFGHSAELPKLETLVRRLDDWLNGAVFPIDFHGPNAPSQEHVTTVASVFAGDDVFDDGGRQLHFDFARYNFKYIPIETLSVIYQQFLHAPDADDRPVNGSTRKSSRGREAGAYYTPLPVVNLMLAEMEDRLPLKKGMRILDPACGSGAYLVQCYRRLIEKELPANRNRHYSLPELRKLLEDHIFGVERDPDACSVTELSLTLTLLDYVYPPDLNGDERRKLPLLRNRNIFRADFFDDDSPCADALKQRRFDWIVGNPPWKTLTPLRLNDDDRPSWSWIVKNKSTIPVPDNQVAIAFAWRVSQYLTPSGEVALLLPAITLFESPARPFRKAFFARMEVHTVANLSNLRHVLFRGDPVAPAAAFFYRPRPDVVRTQTYECVCTYSPFLANQAPVRSSSKEARKRAWSLVVNASEIQEIPINGISDGSGLPWKLAMWGLPRDQRLLKRLSRRFRSLAKLDKDQVLTLSQGPELRDRLVPDGSEKTEYCPQVVDQRYLDPKQLVGRRVLFKLPEDALKLNADNYLRLRGGRRGLKVCKPPHVIVNAGRTYAIYSDKYLIIRPRQIGIAGKSSRKALLRALSAYLNSDFAFYHQFFCSTQFGAERDVATLDAMKQMPIPLAELADAELNKWVELHSQLVRLPPGKVDVKSDDGQLQLSYSDGGDCSLRADLIRELNDLTNESLGLDSRERALVHDLKHVRLELNDGKLGQPAVRPPEPKEMRTYAKRLKSELDAFIGNELRKRHSVGVVYDELSAMISVNLTKDTIGARRIIVEPAGAEGARQLEKTRRRLRKKVSQWVYFDRNLRLYEGTRTYLFKPMQRFHWTESQAMCDAGEIIAETLEG